MNEKQPFTPGTLAELYQRVVRKSILPSLKTAPRLPDGWSEGLGYNRLVVAMSRVALKILVGGATATTLEFDDLSNLLGWCGIEPDESGVWPNEWFVGNPEWTHRFDPETHLAIRTLGLWHLETEGGSWVLSFIHDSFIYYFAALTFAFPASPRVTAYSGNAGTAGISPHFVPFPGEVQLPRRVPRLDHHRCRDSEQW